MKARLLTILAPIALLLGGLPDLFSTKQQRLLRHLHSRSETGTYQLLSS
jgi:hypothetical protein